MQTSIHDVAARGFEAAPDAYERGRPEYPAAAVAYLVQHLAIQPSTVIVDLGAGTGKFTKFLIPTGAKLIAVEPVAGMRKKLSELLPSVQSIEGTAEKIPLPNGSVDAVIVAQAFHWFNGSTALREIHRVLKSGGRLGLIWNARDESLDWVAQLTDIIDPHEKGAPRYRSGEWKRAFETTSLFTPLEMAEFRHSQIGPPEMVVDRVASISFISALSESEKALVLDQVRSLIRSHPLTSNKTILELPYRTDVFWCERK